MVVIQKEEELRAYDECGFVFIEQDDHNGDKAVICLSRQNLPRLIVALRMIYEGSE